MWGTLQEDLGAMALQSHPFPGPTEATLCPVPKSQIDKLQQWLDMIVQRFEAQR